jgi:hypothetical protein
MDLRTHFAVLRRFRLLVVASVLLGTVLAAVALFEVPPKDGGLVQFRKKEVWSSTSTLYITQPGFPEGRILAGGESEPGASTTRDGGAPRFGDMQRFSALAITYSYLLMSDEVRKAIGPIPAGAEIVNTAVSEGTGSNKEILPLISIDGRAEDPQLARELNEKAIKALTSFVSKQQIENGIPERERVRISVITPPSVPTVAVPHSYTAGIVLWILSVMLGLGLAYLLENLRPSVAATPFEGDDDDSDGMLESWEFAVPEMPSSPQEHEHSSVRDG